MKYQLKLHMQGTCNCKEFSEKLKLNLLSIKNCIILSIILCYIELLIFK